MQNCSRFPKLLFRIKHEHYRENRLLVLDSGFTIEKLSFFNSLSLEMKTKIVPEFSLSILVPSLGECARAAVKTKICRGDSQKVRDEAKGQVT